MEMSGIEVTFEPRVPVAGQVLILDALDTLYSLFALGETDWKDEFASGDEWRRFVVAAPGKLLRSEYLLAAESARTGSVIQTVGGYAKTIAKLVKFLLTYRQQVEKSDVKLAQDKLKLVAKELLPLIDKLKKRGIDKERIAQLLQRAYTLTDDVLTSLVLSGKLAISPVESPTKPAKPCPTCRGAGRLP